MNTNSRKAHSFYLTTNLVRHVRFCLIFFRQRAQCYSHPHPTRPKPSNLAFASILPPNLEYHRPSGIRHIVEVKENSNLDIKGTIYLRAFLLIRRLTVSLAQPSLARARRTAMTAWPRRRPARTVASSPTPQFCIFQCRHAPSGSADDPVADADA